MSRYLNFLCSITFIPFIESLRCFAGNPIDRNECSSLSHCLRITSRAGDSQWSCDGNSVNHISLCAIVSQNSQKGNPNFVQFENQRFTRPGQDHPQRYSNDRIRAVSAPHQELCYDAGVLGDVCCCQSDFCNAASGADVKTSLIISLLSSAFLPLLAQLL